MTARRLVLVRHAKAADGSPDLRRPLAPRGLRDATAIGSWLADNGLVPDLAVVSPALRTVQTWQQATAALSTRPGVEEDERIYGNSVDALLEVVRETAHEVGTLALVGHNPSMAALADELDDRTGERDVRDELHRRGFPTSAVAVFAVDAAWADLELHGARLTAFCAPRG